jgi:hypothetical protein
MEFSILGSIVFDTIEIIVFVMNFYVYVSNNGVSVEVFLLFNYCNFKRYRELCLSGPWVEKN